MSTSWQPGDPLYQPPPAEGEPAPSETGIRRGGGRPMVWTARRSRPGPWSWLQPGTRPVPLDVAA